MIKVKRIFRNAIERFTPGTKRSLPVSGLHQPLSLEQLIARGVHRHLSEAAAARGLESYDEFEDYEIREEDDFHSTHEIEYSEELGRDAYKAEIARYKEMEASAGKEIETFRKSQKAKKREAKVDNNAPAPAPKEGASQ